MVIEKNVANRASSNATFAPEPLLSKANMKNMSNYPMENYQAVTFVHFKLAPTMAFKFIKEGFMGKLKNGARL